MLWYFCFISGIENCQITGIYFVEQNVSDDPERADNTRHPIRGWKKAFAKLAKESEDGNVDFKAVLDAVQEETFAGNEDFDEFEDMILVFELDGTRQILLDGNYLENREVKMLQEKLKECDEWNVGDEPRKITGGEILNRKKIQDRLDEIKTELEEEFFAENCPMKFIKLEALLKQRNTFTT